MNETELVEKLREGNLHAFDCLLDQYETPVFRLINGMLKNYQDAQDLTQEVFVTVYEKINGLKDDRRLRPWVYRIAVNKSKNFLKRKKIVRFISMDWLFLHENREFEDTSLCLQASVEDKEKISILYRALVKLPEKYRELILLSEINELKYDDISEILKIPIGTVKSRLYRGKEKLKHVLIEEGYDATY